MKTQETDQYQGLDELLTEQFNQQFERISADDTPKIKALRKKSFAAFEAAGFPDSSQEKWRFTEIESALDQQFTHLIEEEKSDKNIEDIFRCEVHNFESEIISVLNGWHHHRQQALTT
ncbi:MAG: hypothetical protein IT219_02470, partial [Bacteroidales bacterium]|nr:hypothetical protein [Bacteroidales bacterium]